MIPSPPIITAFTAGVLIVTQMALLLNVVILRRRNRQSLGDGGSPALIAAIRRHGNFAENAAIFIACSTLVELMNGGGRQLEIVCGMFVLGRVAHVAGLSMPRTVNAFRIGGIVLTVWAGVMLGVDLIAAAWTHL